MHFEALLDQNRVLATIDNDSFPAKFSKQVKQPDQKLCMEHKNVSTTDFPSNLQHHTCNIWEMRHNKAVCAEKGFHRALSWALKGQEKGNADDFSPK